ncbi:ankyrin repeat domain-containing protein [bacterium]|nr:ankyrin repeat domain-containing protein [bacterium]
MKGKLGNTALGCAVYMGPNRRELVELLLEKGAIVNSSTSNGTSNLISACANEDADLGVVRILLQNHARINQRIRAKTATWHAIYAYSVLAVRTGFNRSVLMMSLAERQGRTALHYAARRGDLALVELLLSFGANPTIKDNVGRRVKDVCCTFPELRGVLVKRERKMKLRGMTEKNHVVEALGKRISTATPIQHEMWLISLETLLMLYVYFCRVDFSLTLIYLIHHTHKGTENVARVVSWKFIRS